MNRSEFLQILESRNFSQLRGNKESSWLECKDSPYNIAQDYQKQELAKDVCAFANSAEGGFLLIGVATRKSQTTAEDVISDICSMAETLLNKNDYLNVLENWVHPRIQGLEIKWIKELGTDKGVFVIEIPKQPEEFKPYLVRIRFGDKPESKLTETVFGLIERKLDSSRAHSVNEIHELLKLGRTFDREIASQFQTISLRLDALAPHSTHQGNTTAVSPFGMDELLPLLGQARGTVKLTDARTLGIILMPATSVSLAGWDRNDSDLIRAMEHPISLRPNVGWGLETGDQARLFAGKLRRVAITNMKILELYRNGTVLFVGAIHERFLAWNGVAQAMRLPSYQINPLTLAEVLLNFSYFVREVLNSMQPRSQELKGYLQLTRMAPDREPGTRLSPMYIGNELKIISGESRSAPEPEMKKEFSIDVSSFTFERLAYQLAAEIYLWFGFDITTIPFLAKDADAKSILDSSEIKGISSEGHRVT